MGYRMPTIPVQSVENFNEVKSVVVGLRKTVSIEIVTKHSLYGNSTLNV
jgi:hypothetical protein